MDDLAEDFDCPSLVCKELEDLETDNHRRGREEDGNHQEKDENAGEETKPEEEEEEEEQEEEEEDKAERVSEKEEVAAAEGAEQEARIDEHEEEKNKQQAEEPQCSGEKDEQKKSKKRRGKKPNERAGSRRGPKDERKCEEDKKSHTQEVSAVSSEESSAPSEPPIGLMNSCDLSDPVYLGCGGPSQSCPPGPLPLLYSSQPPVAIQPAPPPPHGTKRPHSPRLGHSLPQQGPQPLEMEITQVYSTRRSIRYSTRGRGRALSFSLLPGLETVDGCLLPPAPKKKTRTLYSSDQLEHLEALFQEDHYPDAEKRKLIAVSVGVTPQRIMVWFQNRRAKWRKVERLVTGKVEHRQSKTGWSGGSPRHHVSHALSNMAASSKGVPAFSGHFAPKLPQLDPAAASFSSLPALTPPPYSSLLASFSSPGHTRMRDGGHHQPEFHPRPMCSPPPLRRASLPLFTTTYNPAAPLPNTPAHSPSLFVDALEGGSSSARHDSHALQTDSSSLFDFGEKLDFLTSSQQSNTLSYQLQSSYPGSQPPPPQHLRQPQASLPHTAYLTPSPYLTPSAPDSNLTSYMTFGPGGNSSGVVTYSTGGQAYVQSQSAGQLLLQSAGHHGGVTAYPSYPWGNMYSQPTVHQRNQCPPNYPASFGAAPDLQPPSSTSLPPSASFFQQGDLSSSHTLTHTSSSSSSSSLAVLPPVSTLRPSRLRAETTPTKVAPLLPAPLIPSSLQSPPVPPCAKIEYDSPREIHSHFHCDFSSIHF